jgi:signal transduction histidine kinase
MAASTEFLDIQVLASLARDAELICHSLATAGIECRVGASVGSVAADIPERADILIVLEEAIDETAIGHLAEALRGLPPWSDPPVIVLTGGGAASGRSERLAQMREPLGNVTLIERPVRPITVISSVRAAIRARQKQYEVRDHLKNLKQAEDALRRSHEKLERQVAERTAALRQLSSSLMRSQDEERRRIARELHDSLGQYLAGLSMELYQLAETGDRQFLSDARKTLDTCISETRTLSHLLHPPLLDEVGLTSAVQWYVEGFVVRSGIEVELEVIKIPRLPRHIETTIFRVLQEALTNIHRHSGAKKAKVSLSYCPSKIMLDVIDHGKGMPQAHFDRFQSSGTAGGVGLAGIRERISEISGELQVTSSSQGTQVRVAVPLNPNGRR